MRGLYSHRFTLPSGVTVCIPSPEGRARGEAIVKEVRGLWNPRNNFYHIRKGGHVAAARRHASSKVIAKLDLAKFYHQVSRTKVHRGLKLIGMDQQEAWETACDSTVERDVGKRNFSLPFGFVQSPLLASVVLDHSALGQQLRKLDRKWCRVSAYVDDIIVSSDEPAVVDAAILAIRDAAKQSGFSINEEKSEGPAPEVQAFNIHLGSGRMEITGERMQLFREAVAAGNDFQIAGILDYVASVNEKQLGELGA